MSGRSPRWFSGIKYPGSRLPDGYKELSYIESSGGEYINTDVSVDATNYNKSSLGTTEPASSSPNLQHRR